MKKFVSFVVIAAVAFSMLTGCGQDNNLDVAEINERESSVEHEDVWPKAENGIPMYVVTFYVKQSHFTLNIKEHIKDAMNEVSFDVPVDKEYYDSVSVGDVIKDDFRVGSLIMHGSFGKCKVTVGKKEERYPTYGDAP